MLHHRQPAVIGCLGKLGFIACDVAKGNLLIFLGIGINRRTGKGGNHHGFTFRCDVIALQLEVSVRGKCLGTAVGNFPSHINQIRTPFEGQNFGNFDAIGSICFKANLQFIGTFGKFRRSLNALED